MAALEGTVIAGIVAAFWPVQIWKRGFPVSPYLLSEVTMLMKGNADPCLFQSFALVLIPDNTEQMML
jgi:hypothetical protein